YREGGRVDERIDSLILKERQRRRFPGGVQGSQRGGIDRQRFQPSPLQSRNECVDETQVATHTVSTIERNSNDGSPAWTQSSPALERRGLRERGMVDPMLGKLHRRLEAITREQQMVSEKTQPLREVVGTTGLQVGERLPQDTWRDTGDRIQLRIGLASSTHHQE